MLLFFREIFENAIAPKAKRLSANEHEEITTLLIQKDNELKETMKLAAEQGDIDKKMKVLHEELQKQDNCIKQLQKQLKDAETLLVSISGKRNQISHHIYMFIRKVHTYKRTNWINFNWI